MKKLILLSVLVLAGCSDATRTVPVLVLDERTISGDIPREPLKIPSDYKDPVLADWNKNNFLGPVKSVPLPPPRPKQ